MVCSSGRTMPSQETNISMRPVFIGLISMVATIDRFESVHHELQRGARVSYFRSLWGLWIDREGINRLNDDRIIISTLCKNLWIATRATITNREKSQWKNKFKMFHTDTLSQSVGQWRTSQHVVDLKEDVLFKAWKESQEGVSHET